MLLNKWRRNQDWNLTRVSSNRHLNNWALGCGVQGIQNPVNDWAPKSKSATDKESFEIRHPQREIQTPGLPWITLPYMGRTIRTQNFVGSKQQLRRQYAIILNNWFMRQSAYVEIVSLRRKEDCKPCVTRVTMILSDKLFRRTSPSFKHRGVARISGRGGSKLLPTKTVVLKSLHYVRTRLWRLRYANRRRLSCVNLFITSSIFMSRW